MEQQVLSITQINEYIRTLMDRDPALTSLAVCGEISNYNRTAARPPEIKRSRNLRY